MVRTNTAARRVPFHGLVAIYADAGERNPACDLLNQAAGLAEGTAREATTQRGLRTLEGGTK